jgi:hypothetical protein
MYRIMILRCHVDSFLAHKGWWAMMRLPPDLAVGDIVDFVLPEDNIKRCRVTSLKQPFDPLYKVENSLDEKMRKFVDWGIIFYKSVEDIDAPSVF